MTRACSRPSAVTKRFSGLVAVDGVDLSIARGEMRGIVGPNGAGKTTLFNLVSGLYAVSGGRIRLDGRDVTAARSARAGRRRPRPHVPDAADLPGAEPLRQRRDRARRRVRPPPARRGARSAGAPGGATTSPSVEEALALRRGCRRISARSRARSRSASRSASRSPAPSWAAPRCCCSTSRRPASTAAEIDALVELVGAIRDPRHHRGAHRAQHAVRHGALRPDQRARLRAEDRRGRPPTRSAAIRSSSRRTWGGAPVLVCDGLHAGYGRVPVLHGVSLAVRPDELVALIGPNGAGKTTMLHAIVGLLRPRHGAASPSGAVAASGAIPPTSSPAGIALVPQGRMVFQSLTVRENLRLGAYRADAGGGGRARSRPCSRRSPRCATAWAARRHALRRPAADARHRAGADVEPDAAAPRRAVDRAWRRRSWNRSSARWATCTARGR